MLRASWCILPCFTLHLPSSHMDPVEEGLVPCLLSLSISLPSPLLRSLFSNQSFGTKAPQQTYILSIAWPLAPRHLVNPLTTALPSPEPWSGFPQSSTLTPGLRADLSPHGLLKLSRGFLGTQSSLLRPESHAFPTRAGVMVQSAPGHLLWHSQPVLHLLVFSVSPSRGHLL